MSKLGRLNQPHQPSAAPPVGGVANHTSYSLIPETPAPYSNDEDDVFDNVDLQSLTQRPSLAPPSRGGDILAALTSKPPSSSNPPMSMAVLTLIILASLCLVVGAIYLLIYFKSIKPMSARSRSYADPGGGKGDDDGGARKSAGHPFFRRK
jgi:hypothetical protein